MKITWVAIIVVGVAGAIKFGLRGDTAFTVMQSIFAGIGVIGLVRSYGLRQANQR